MPFTKKPVKTQRVKLLRKVTHTGPEIVYGLKVSHSTAKVGKVHAGRLMEAIADPRLEAADLAHDLNTRVHLIAGAMGAGRGVEVVDNDVESGLLLVMNAGDARAAFPRVMTRVRKSLVAFISKRGKPDDSVAVLDLRALEMIVELAEQSLRSTKKFGDLMGVFPSPEDARKMSVRDFNRPLAIRQSVADRKRAIAEVMEGTS